MLSQGRWVSFFLVESKVCIFQMTGNIWMIFKIFTSMSKKEVFCVFGFVFFSIISEIHTSITSHLVVFSYWIPLKFEDEWQEVSVSQKLGVQKPFQCTYGLFLFFFFCLQVCLVLTLHGFRLRDHLILNWFNWINTFIFFIKKDGTKHINYTNNLGGMFNASEYKIGFKNLNWVYI